MMEGPVLATNDISLDTSMFPSAPVSAPLSAAPLSASPLADVSFSGASFSGLGTSTAVPVHDAVVTAVHAASSATPLFSLASSLGMVALLVAGVRKIWDSIWK